RIASRAASTIRTLRRCVGLCTPGVSTNTIWPRVSHVRPPTTRVGVVCGLFDTMATFSPTIRLSRVDLPALGRPISETKPAFMRRLSRSSTRLRRFRRRSFPAADADLGDPAPLDFHDFNGEAVHVEHLAQIRHAPEV